MQLFVEKVLKFRLGWNTRALSETDFYRLCRRFRITVIEIPLSTNGFYYCVKKEHFIAIDSRLGGHNRLFVMFHELAHFLMHAPVTSVAASFYGVGKRTRKEIEADAFALCAIMPRRWIDNRATERFDEEAIPPEMIERRLAIFHRYNI